MAGPPVYDWQEVGTSSPYMMIHQTNGRLYWNAKTHQQLGNPPSVKLAYDEGTNSICVEYGFDFRIYNDDEGLISIDAHDALVECGLEFPLAGHIEGEPVYLLNSQSKMVFALGE